MKTGLPKQVFLLSQLIGLLNERDIVAFQTHILVLCEKEFHNITDLTQTVILELNRCKIAPYSFHIQQVEIVDNRPKIEVIIIKDETT
jgi:hypothetical protein